MSSTIDSFDKIEKTTGLTKERATDANFNEMDKTTIEIPFLRLIALYLCIQVVWK